MRRCRQAQAATAVLYSSHYKSLITMISNCQWPAGVSPAPGPTLSDSLLTLAKRLSQWT